MHSSASISAAAVIHGLGSRRHVIRKPGEEEHFRCTVEHTYLFNDGLCRLEGDIAEDGHLLPLGGIALKQDSDRAFSFGSSVLLNWQLAAELNICPHF